MADTRKHGAISNLVRFKLSHTTTMEGLTGLGIASTGLIISTISNNEAAATSYTVLGSTIESITTLGTYAAPTATKCRFKEVDATNHPGLYEFQFADARFAVASAKDLVITVSGATNLRQTDYQVRLVSFDPDDVVRMGMTSLPNAAASAAGGLPVSAAGALAMDTLADWVNAGRLDTILDTVAAAVAGLGGAAMRGTDGANTVVPDNTTIATIAGYLDTEIAAILADTGTTLPGLIAAVAPAVADEALAGHSTAGTVGKAISDVLADVAGLGGAAMRGTDGANTVVPDNTTIATIAGYLDTEIAAILADTGELQTDWANGGRLDLLIDAIKAKTDSLPMQIKKNTARANFPFWMIDTAGNPVTGLTVTATRSIDGAVFAACANAVGEVGFGLYKISLAAADLNGDTVALLFTAPGAKNTGISVVTQS